MLGIEVTKACSKGSGQMTKMAATLIYEKQNTSKIFSETERPLTLGLGM